MDLFTPKVPAERLHPRFVELQDEKEADTCTVLTEWSSGFVDRDGNFEKEFQTKFNQQVWELYLHAAFQKLGFSVDFSHVAPDFALDTPQGDVVAEATTMQHAEGYQPEWEDAEAAEADKDDLIRHASIRLSNSISAKLSKYLTSYSAAQHVVGRPFLLCVAAYEQPYYYKQRDLALRRVLYGDDGPLVVSVGGEKRIVGVSKRFREVKQNLAPLEFGLFTREDAPEISGVLFSSLANLDKARALARSDREDLSFAFVQRFNQGADFKEATAASTDYEEALLAGLHLCLNPYASNPIDPEPFEAKGIAIHRYNPTNSAYAMFAPDGYLEERVGLSKDARQATAPPAVTAVPATPPTPGFAERELMPMEGHSFFTKKDHLSHYRGWTVHLSFYEGDWCSHGVKKLVKSIQGFIDANADSSIDYVFPKCEFATKQEAADYVFSEINEKEG